MTSATITLPPVTPAFRDAVRELAMQVGWRNVAKRIAYGPVLDIQAPASPNGNGHKRNGSKKLVVLSWWEKGQLEQSWYYPPTKWEDYLNMLGIVAERRREIETTRFYREIPWPFTPARPTADKVLDQTDARMALYPVRECCGSPMGIMESWGKMSVLEMQGSDSGYQDTPVRAIYQCAVNAAHKEEAYAMSGAAALSNKAKKRADRQARKG
jgi:hypothetical protein